MARTCIERGMNFINRVVTQMENEGWSVEMTPCEPVTLICKKYVFKRGLLIKAHGRVSKQKWQAAYDFGKTNN